MSFIFWRIVKNALSPQRVSFYESYRFYPVARKRFYRSVHVTESDGKFEINLDKQKLKTPLGNLLQLPNEALAVAVATEWDTQGDILQQHNMHISSLCNTAFDNPCRETKESLSDSVLQFLASDTLCFRSNDPPELVDFQNEKWNPILDWFQSRYQVETNVSEDVSSVTVSEQGLQEIRKQLLSHNTWSLIGLNFAAENMKSLILTFALTNHQIDIETAVYLSRLETIFQVNRWGNVEWSHDVDKAQTTSRVAAAALFIYLNEGSTNYVEKLSSKKESRKIQANQ